ncbi:MAG: EAL domain-containing protein [Chloroflexi bacterium]|nr:EAL domain-containing protein [Chloroflexota bacterium]
MSEAPPPKRQPPRRAPSAERLEDLLRRRTELFQALLEAQREIGEGLAIAEGLRILYANDALCTMLGYSFDELAALPSLLEIIPATERARVLERARPSEGGNLEASYFETAVVHKHGHRVDVEVGVTRLRVEGHDRVVLIARDISARKQAEAALIQSEDRFRSLVQNASDIMSILAADGTILWHSPSLERVLGYAPDALAGASLYDYVHPDDASRVAAAFAASETNAAAPVVIDFRVRHRDGSWRHLEASGANLLDHPAVQGIVVNSRDVTERKAFEDQLARQAFFDPLTGLPNRVLFMYSIEHALAGARRNKVGVAVMFLDLDGFKRVNDTFGHQAGDQLLVALGQRLKACVRPGDTVARLGGDEFTILLEDIPYADEATRVAQRILDRLQEPFPLDGRDVYVGTSIGIAFGMPGESEPPNLLRFADAAMYRAKAAGKGRYVVFDGGMRADWVARAGLESDLRGALEQGAFRLAYQPTFDLITRRIAGVEALLRWEHPERGVLQPRDFLSMAEETGAIVPIGQWVLEEACRQAQAWQHAFPNHAPLGLGVNLSARQLQQPDVVQQVERAVAASGLNPALLQLELTEAALLDDTRAIPEKLQALRALGVRLALDDFGAGLSSLSQVRRAPLACLKFDVSLVSRLDRQSVEVVRALTALARALGLAVCAEGIETTEQLALLLEAGCDRGQGYYLSPPIAAEAVTRLIAGAASGEWGR